LIIRNVEERVGEGMRIVRGISITYSVPGIVLFAAGMRAG